MSRSLNKIMLIGNLGQDPEIRTTGSGQRVGQFSLATTRTWNDQQGQKQEKTEWHRIVVWGRLVDVVERVKARGAHECYLEVRESNREAQSIYRQRGFIVVGRRPRYYSLPTEDALVMRLRVGDFS